MSVPDTRVEREPPPPADPPRKGCLPALIGLIGVLLLLPGICSFLFMLTVRATPDLWSLGLRPTSWRQPESR